MSSVWLRWRHVGNDCLAKAEPKEAFRKRQNSGREVGTMASDQFSARAAKQQPVRPPAYPLCAGRSASMRVSSVRRAGIRI